MSGFNEASDGDFDRVFFTNTELFENFVGTTLWTCGYNLYGHLGDNTTVSKSSPVTTIAGGTNWKQVECGGAHTAAIKTDGTLWTWGYNGYGQLGDNTNVAKSSPVTTVAGGTNWKQVATGGFHTAAIKTDGTLWSWGSNSSGELGDNTAVAKSSPVQVSGGGTNWKQVALIGQGGPTSQTLAIKTDGTLWSWGYNAYGQLGDNTTVAKSSPVQVSGGGTNWKQVATGTSSHTAAIKTDGTLWTWGYNGYGQLGDNTTVNKSSPNTTIAGGTNWKQVAAASSGYTAAIKTDGTLWTCGYNFHGQLGNNSTVSKSSPNTTIAGGTNWKQVSCGPPATAAIKTDGTLWTWGYNLGQLGDNTTVAKSSPVTTVAGGTNWKQVSTGSAHTAALGQN
jgi:alpha-tubulin suppressor-like RCC1 family protein